MHKVLAFGSNLGNRSENIIAAIRLLESHGISIERRSSLYETEPLDCSDGGWFLNQVACVVTSHTVTTCLEICQQIEQQLGRIRSHQNALRPIDIDLLLWGDAVIQSPDLIIPHPRMHERKFVLVPLLEILPDPRLLAWIIENMSGQGIRKVTS